MADKNAPVSATASSNGAERQESKNTPGVQTPEIPEPLPEQAVQNGSYTRNTQGDYDRRMYPVLTAMNGQRELEVKTHELTERALALRQAALRLERQRQQEERRYQGQLE